MDIFKNVTIQIFGHSLNFINKIKFTKKVVFYFLSQKYHLNIYMLVKKTKYPL